MKAWAERNPEKKKKNFSDWRKKNADYDKQRCLEWQKTNKEKTLAGIAKYKAAKIRRIPPWADMAKIEAVYIERERIERETGVPHDVDHIIPLQGKTVSGFHVHTNLQVIPRAENRRKGNRLKDGH